MYTVRAQMPSYSAPLLVARTSPHTTFPDQGPDAFLRQPYHQLRHPKIFYYGHPAVVYVNKFRVAGLLDDGIDPFIEQVGG